MKAIHITAASTFALALALAGPVAAAGMSGGGTGASGTSGVSSFSDLDKDGNGYLTKQEAAGHSDLVNKWNQVDSNGDDQIDSTEFSAFEIEESSQPASPMKSSPESGSGGGAGTVSPSRQY
jgi:hypothetical protein